MAVPRGIGSKIVAGLFCAMLLSVARASEINFARDVQPILADKCYMCHGPDAAHRKGDLRLDMLDKKIGPFVPRDGYSIVVPKNLDDSILIARITSDDADSKMPPPKAHRELSAKQIEVLKQWILQGAKWGKHWAFVEPVKAPLPIARTQRVRGTSDAQLHDPAHSLSAGYSADADWSKNPIDCFIESRLEKEGLTHSPRAPRDTLIRRLTLDLTGLPATPAEVDAFLNDSSPDAYEKVVDRLLASPHYGETMAWDWLDAARYADTNGYQADPTRTAWPWRDWVVKAFNQNLSYDKFTLWQIAGDLIPHGTPEMKLATSFLRMHPFNGEGGRIAEETRAENVFDRTDTVGTVFLGLTVQCAKCHDHKYDPIAQREYYSMFAYFNQCSETGGFQYVQGGNVLPVMDYPSAQQSAQIVKRTRAVAEAKERLKRETASVDAKQIVWEENVRFGSWFNKTCSAKLSTPGIPPLIEAAIVYPSTGTKGLVREFYRTRISKDYPKLKANIADAEKSLEELKNRIPKVMVMDDATRRETHILSKGGYDKLLEKVTPGVPAVLNELPKDGKNDRLALGKWLIDAKNPLLARVTVNRYWQKFFGTGIVKTAEDFGIQGERPTHPELLDYLAVEFRDSGWDLKKLVRLIVTSETYKQSSKVTPELLERDPENRLLARMSRFRLPSVVIRDQALACGGLLSQKIGGKPVNSYQPPGIWEEATFGKTKYEQSHGEDLYRRGIYLFWRRIVGPTIFFDSASRSTCVVRPSRTNSPLHALTTLNDVTYVESARALAQRVMKSSSSDQDRIEMIGKIVLSRKFSDGEMNVLLAAVNRLKNIYAKDTQAAKKLLSVGESKRDESLPVSEHAAYTAVCLEVLNLDEAVTRE